MATKSNSKSVTKSNEKAVKVTKEKKVVAPVVKDEIPQLPTKLANPVAGKDAAPAKTETVANESKRTIEKDRPEQNGVKQPSAGGMCRAVWDFCTSASASGSVVTATAVKAQAVTAGWNANNAMIEYYQWRKFNGIRGRIAKPAATDATPAA